MRAKPTAPTLPPPPLRLRLLLTLPVLVGLAVAAVGAAFWLTSSTALGVAVTLAGLLIWIGARVFRTGYLSSRVAIAAVEQSDSEG